MASSKEYVDFILEQLSGLEEVTSRPMMGEYLIYYRGKVVGDICDNRLYLTPVAAAKELLPGASYAPPYPGAKDMLLVEDVDDRELLTRVVEAMYEQLPARRAAAVEPYSAPSFGGGLSFAGELSGCLESWRRFLGVVPGFLVEKPSLGLAKGRLHRL